MFMIMTMILMNNDVVTGDAYHRYHHHSLPQYHHHHRWLQLTTASSNLDLTSLFTNNNATCPKDCRLCECASQVVVPTNEDNLNNTSTTTTTIPTTSSENNDAEIMCIYTKSIEACSMGTLPKCYADLVPFELDIEGLCSVQCTASSEKEQQQQQGDIMMTTAVLCRICDIFSCCNDCPTEDVDKCFPPLSSSDNNGYTPVGWKPLSCENDSSGSSSSHDNILWRMWITVIGAMSIFI